VKAPRSRSCGFTLVELVLVVLVLTIAAAIVIPSIGSAADSQASGAARVVACDLKSAQSLAQTTQQPHTILFSPDRQTYKVVRNYAGEDYADADAIPHPVRAGQLYEMVLRRQGGLGSVTVTDVDFDGDAYVTFDAEGTPSAAGTVTVGAGDILMTVTVQALTGVIEVAEAGG
jgi:prepilin-type N-terminal cleavage/methylation domain-containing protein